jgi:DNA-directed RNA polymerase
VWESSLNVKGLPLREFLPPTAEPAFDRSDKDSIKRWAVWKHSEEQRVRRNLQSRSNRIACHRVLSLAHKFRDEPAIYFPSHIDFRGRVYSMPAFLNPQGSDMAKSLLTFATGKPLGPRGVEWLAIHVANCFGYDKVPMAERSRWTRLNSHKIEKAANDPLGYLWWTEADKPFQFLAACLEWRNCLYGGKESYVCSLPIPVDGTCSGLQHFSALLRDEVCGQHVNLTPGKLPGDIYTEVAKSVEDILRGDIGDEKNDANAREWLAFGIDRKLCKRPTMVLPYGGTVDSFRRYIEEYAVEKGHTFEKNFKARTAYLTSVMDRAMKAVIKGPRVAMSWLQTVARMLSRQGLPITWTAPTGLIVFQRYPNMIRSRVKTRLGESICKFTLTEEGDDINKKKQTTAVSPNFVHSLDAAALMFTVNQCHNQGITSFLAVHDSYGTWASDMDTLAKTLRQEFVSMYQADDLLAKFREELQAQAEEPLPETPPKGSLDISGVLLSPFFFS